MELPDIEKLTVAQVRELLAIISGHREEVTAHPYPVGAAVFIRTVTMHYTGRLIEVTPGELVLEDAAWVADSGLFHVALMKGDLNEVEPFPDGRVIVPRGGVIDVSIWKHALPRTAK